jgi:uncharacterized membrane protein HdeD (DUF308 family)
VTDAVSGGQADNRSGAALLLERRASLALRSAAGMLFAVAFFWPALSQRMLVDLFAGYVFVDGILTLSAGGWSLAWRPLWPLLLGGCINLAAGVAAYAWPGLSLSGFAGLVTIWAAALGIAFTLASATLRRGDPDRLLLLGGIACGLYARALLSLASPDVVVLSTWAGLHALSLGIILCKLTLQHSRPWGADFSAE